jgi:tRNA A-37 threonylcarbamoyl transferase component Bud32
MLPITPPRLGRYEIVDEIGKGAMGVVYLARDPLIGRLVALKTFRIGYSIKDHELEQFRARFIREAQSAGILGHPNIVTIHDVVEDAGDGMAFIAMEYVRGTNLKALLQGDQPLSLQFVADVISQVAEALDYAHSHKVVHRDVKPANILITADNRVKITDFGIARLDTSNLTQEGQLLGTPNYMAPEQIQGKEVDHRADLFALGVVLYELLTRHKPFQGENLTVVSHRIVYDHFTPPKDYVRELPPGLEPILTRALEKDPARRYQRAKDLAEDLRRVSGRLASDDLNETQSISAMAPALTPPPPLPGPGTLAGQVAAAPARPAAAPRPARPRPPFSLRRAVTAAVLAAIVTLTLGGGALLSLAWTTPASLRNPAEEAVRTEFLAAVRTGHELLPTDPVRASQLYRRAEQLVPGKPGLIRLRQQAEKQVQGSPELEAARRQLAEKILEAQRALGQRQYEKAIEAATTAVGLDPSSREAQAILAAAFTAQADMRARAARDRTQRPPQGQVATTTIEPTPEQVPASPEPAPEAVPAQDATLRITFDTDRPGAIVMVRIGQETLLREKVGGKGGFFRRSRGGGSAGKSVRVKTGSARIEVWVTPPGQVSQHMVVPGFFSAGENRHLAIRLPSSGQASAGLQ